MICCWAGDTCGRAGPGRPCRPWWTKETVAVVTGANKGVGFEIVRLLADQGLTVILTARDPTRGKAALDDLQKTGVQVNSVFYHPLDVLSTESVEVLGKWLKKKFGGLDILINNAGIAYSSDGETVSYKNAMAIMDTNYYGVKRVTEALQPLLRQSPQGARIVNITSGVSIYNRFKSEELKDIFRADTFTEELVDSLASEYLEDVREHRWAEKWVGGPGPEGRAPIYSVSKVLLNAYSIGFARSLWESQPPNHRIFLVVFTPGLTMTDLAKRANNLGGANTQMMEDVKANTPTEGADTGVWLALLPKGELAEKNGKLFCARQEFPFSAEKVVS